MIREDTIRFCEQMDFPNTFDEFAEVYGFKDKDEIYTNGSELIPVFRVKQWLEHISTTKNDSKFCPDRKAKTTHAEGFLHCIENDCVAYKDGKCLKYNSDQEPTTKNDLKVEEVIALTEWTEKLAKASKEAYRRGYLDCNEKVRAFQKLHDEERELKDKLNKIDIEDAWKCGFEQGVKHEKLASPNICPHCGEYIGEEK